MNLADIRRLYAYNRWANDRFVEILRGLDPQQLSAHVESSFPSLLATLAHLVGADWVWLRRWQGDPPKAFPGWLEAPDLDDLLTRWARISDERDRFLAELPEDRLAAPFRYHDLAGRPHRKRLLDLLLHVVNHSTYHRGQLTTMLRQVGATPVASDYVYFLEDLPD